MTVSSFTASSTDSWPRPADPTGTGMGGSGQKLSAEFSDAPHKRGVHLFHGSCAWSPTPLTASSSSALTDVGFLDGQYTVWGEVIEGMEHVDKIKRGEPVQDPDQIVSMKVAADA
jgi:peptidylprolyl isomerase